MQKRKNPVSRRRKNQVTPEDNKVYLDLFNSGYLVDLNVVKKTVKAQIRTVIKKLLIEVSKSI